MLRICREFHCLPSEARAEDVTILRLLRIESLGTPEPEPEGGEF